MYLVIMIFMVTAFLNSYNDAEEEVKLGVFADCQYCDCETMGTRFYRNSTVKLEECISHFNNNTNIDFIVNVGDLIDRDFESFADLKPVLMKSEREIVNIPGNHDLEVDPVFRRGVPGQLGLKKMYHSSVKNGWMFIFTDGNDISFNSDDPEIVKQAVKLTAKLKEEGKPNHYEWNGGIGREQLAWLEKQLKTASKKKLKTAIFCHYPLLPYGVHSLWNHDEVIGIIKKYRCVKLWMNGHNHAGNYQYGKEIHYVTLKGMVETENENAFAEVTFSDDMIEIKGYGREESRKLNIEF